MAVRIRLVMIGSVCCIGMLLSTCGCRDSVSKGDTRAYELIPRREPRDPSLRLEEYIRNGMPVPDHVWSGRDLAKAASVLAAIAKEDVHCLPRYASARSGAVFARIIAPENLIPLQDRKTPIKSRQSDALMFYQAAEQAFDIYLDAYAKHAVSGRELVEIQGLIFRTINVTLELADESLHVLSKNDLSYPARLAGLEKAKRSGASVVNLGLDYLEREWRLQDSERVTLVDRMEEIFPTLLLRLSPKSRSEIRIRLEKVGDEPGSQVLKPGLTRLIAIVRAIEKNNGQ